MSDQILRVVTGRIDAAAIIFRPNTHAQSHAFAGKGPSHILRVARDDVLLSAEILQAEERGIAERRVTCYTTHMQLADLEAEFPPGEVTFEMSNLSPRETGLDFAVFVSPKMAPHAARIKVTLPPWGSKPAAVYTISPFGLVAGEAWLSKPDEDKLRRWVEANLAALLAYWNGDILYDQDLRAVLVRVDAAT